MEQAEKMPHAEETLIDALRRTKPKDLQEQLKILTDETKKLTKSQILNFANGKDPENISFGVTISLSKLVKRRVKMGEPVFPWDDFAKYLDLDKESRTMCGGIW